MALSQTMITPMSRNEPDVRKATMNGLIARQQLTIPYQVDYSNSFVGRRISHTKRKVRFIFGFASQSAINRGLSGSACRGNEHEIVLVLSWASGKQRVTLDGKEIYQNVDRSASNGTFVLCFNVGQHVCILKGSIGLLAGVGFAVSKSYDLKIDGKSFFGLMKIFQLGNTLENSNNGSITKNMSIDNLEPHRIECGANNEYPFQSDTNENGGDCEVMDPAHVQVHETQQGYVTRKRTNTLPDIPLSPQLPPEIQMHKRSSSQPQSSSNLTLKDEPTGPPQTVHIGDAPTYKTPDDKRKSHLANVIEESWEVLGSVKDDATVTSAQTTKTNVVYPDYFDYYNDYVKKTGQDIPINPISCHAENSLNSLKASNSQVLSLKQSQHHPYTSPNKPFSSISSPALTAYPIYDEQGHTQRSYISPSAGTATVNDKLQIPSSPVKPSTTGPNETDYCMA